MSAIALGSVALAFLLSLGAVVDHFGSAGSERPYVVDAFTWLAGGPLPLAGGGTATFEIPWGFQLDADTVVSEGSWDAATAGAGCVLDAVDMAVDGRAVRSFCAVRPPGHHALRDRSMGFCLFGNVAIGAHYARAKHGLDRILMLRKGIDDIRLLRATDPRIANLDTFRRQDLPLAGHDLTEFDYFLDARDHRV